MRFYQSNIGSDLVSNDYAGNLVPFSGGFVYEENPTITYAPVQDEVITPETETPARLGGLS
jgi:hypothetical protein